MCFSDWWGWKASAHAWSADLRIAWRSKAPSPQLELQAWKDGSHGAPYWGWRSKGPSPHIHTLGGALPVVVDQGVVHLRLTKDYRHLGTFLQEKPITTKDCQLRVQGAKQTMGALMRPFFCRRNVNMANKVRIVDSLVTSKFANNVHTWSWLTGRQLSMWENGFRDMVRKLVQPQLQGIPFFKFETAEVYGLMGALPPQDLLRANRLKYFARMVQAAPCCLWRYVLRAVGPASWMVAWFLNGSNASCPNGLSLQRMTGPPGCWWRRPVMHGRVWWKRRWDRTAASASKWRKRSCGRWRLTGRSSIVAGCQTRLRRRRKVLHGNVGCVTRGLVAGEPWRHMPRKFMNTRSGPSTTWLVVLVRLVGVSISAGRGHSAPHRVGSVCGILSCLRSSTSSWRSPSFGSTGCSGSPKASSNGPASRQSPSTSLSCSWTCVSAKWQWRGNEDETGLGATVWRRLWWFFAVVWRFPRGCGCRSFRGWFRWSGSLRGLRWQLWSWHHCRTCECFPDRESCCLAYLVWLMKSNPSSLWGLSIVRKLKVQCFGATTIDQCLLGLSAKKPTTFLLLRLPWVRRAMMSLGEGGRCDHRFSRTVLRGRDEQGATRRS